MDKQMCECKLGGRTCTNPAEYRYHGVDIDRVLCQKCLTDWSSRWIDEDGNLTVLWHMMMPRITALSLGRGRD